MLDPFKNTNSIPCRKSTPLVNQAGSGKKCTSPPGLWFSILIYILLHSVYCEASSSRRLHDTDVSKANIVQDFTITNGSQAVYAQTIAQSTNIPPNEKTCLFINALSGDPYIPIMGGENNSGKSGKLGCDIHELKRNTDCWLQCDDLSSLSVYQEGWNGTCRRAVLVSPRHVIMAAHFIPDQGGQGGAYSNPRHYIHDVTNSPAIFWISPDNTVVKARLSAVIRNPHRSGIDSSGATPESLSLWRDASYLPDLAIGILSEDIDTNLISVIKWLPEKDFPLDGPFMGVGTSRYLKIFPEESWDLHNARYFSTGVRSPEDPARLNWSRYAGPYKQDGDSSSPNLLYDGQNLFLVGVNTSGGKNRVRGHTIMRTEEQQVIQNAMNGLDLHMNRLPHHELTIIGGE